MGSLIGSLVVTYLTPATDMATCRRSTRQFALRPLAALPYGRSACRRTTGRALNRPTGRSSIRSSPIIGMTALYLGRCTWSATGIAMPPVAAWVVVAVSP